MPTDHGSTGLDNQPIMPATVQTSKSLVEMVSLGESHRRAGRYEQAIAAFVEAIGSEETGDAEICLRLAMCCQKLDDVKSTCRWLGVVAERAEKFSTWQAAAALLDEISAAHSSIAKRHVKASLIGSYTLEQFAPMLRLAALRRGIDLKLTRGHFGQYRQELLNPHSEAYRSNPDVVILAVDSGEVMFPAMSDHPHELVESELVRWTSLWKTFADTCSARLVMHNFAIPPEDALGHLSSRLSGSRSAMMHLLNQRIGEAAGADVAIVDCEALASAVGKRRWFDPRYWHIAKQAVALDALPALAKHTVAVMAAALGMNRKCLVLDLDNTLWGGVVGEDGLSGIHIGQGTAEGEAYSAFQRHVAELKQRGVLLAVCSKNNHKDACEVFEKHPDMQLRLDDFACFVANWEHKPDNLCRIARELDLGLDSLVVVDDNPAERQVIRRVLPEVEVVAMPEDPAMYVRALSDSLLFEAAWLTSDDSSRAGQYRARAQAAELRSAAGSMEDFHRSLKMRAVVAPFDELHLPRISQLVGKTNQFNLTTRRHSLHALRGFMNDPQCVHLYLKLQDQFGDHGLVSVLIARRMGEVMDIDTFLISCRVIGRTVDAEMLSQLSLLAQEHGCQWIRGTYIPTAKNGLVKDLFGQFGFEADSNDAPNGADQATTWRYDLGERGPITNGFIETAETSRSAAHDAA